VKMKFLALFLMLIFVGSPTLINILFFNRPDLFPFYSFEVIPVGLSDHAMTVENSNLPTNTAPFFATRVEVKTNQFHLDPSKIVEVSYYWLSMNEDGFPFGDYSAGFEFREDSSNNTTNDVNSYRLIYTEGVSQIKENEYEFRFPSPALPSWIHGFQLPKAFQNEYTFILVAYTNATINPDELIARLVLVCKYKTSIAIMGSIINLETIGYMTLFLSFALLAVALLFQIIKRKHSRPIRLHSFSCSLKRLKASLGVCALTRISVIPSS
jgi:hypothetical protein